jgi:hypothetical protein
VVGTGVDPVTFRFQAALGVLPDMPVPAFALVSRDMQAMHDLPPRGVADDVSLARAGAASERVATRIHR